MRRVNYLILLLFLFTFASCMEGPGHWKRPLIDPLASQGGTPIYCTDYLDLRDYSCHPQCLTDTYVGSTEEIEKKIIDWSDAEVAALVDEMERAQGVCLPTITAPVRPDLAMEFKSLCACQYGKVAMQAGPSCITECTNRPKSNDLILYGDMKVNEKIELNKDLVNLHGWCNNPIYDSEGIPIGEGANCSFKMTALGGTSQAVAVTTYSGSNRFMANITDQMPYGKTLRVEIIENESGATSKPDDLYLINPNATGNDYDILGTTSIHLYECLKVSLVSDPNTGEQATDLAVKLHYIYPSNDRPPAIPIGHSTIYCHDYKQYGKHDKEEYPRLGTVPGHLAMWSKDDYRMAATLDSSKPDINTTLKNIMEDDYGITGDVGSFFFFPWANMPPEASELQSYVQGILLQAQIDPVSKEVFCPKRHDWEREDVPLLFELGKFIQNDTEALYVAVSEPRVLTGQDGDEVAAPKDYMLIKKSQLESIWFYMQGSQRIPADDDSAKRETIMFNWPPQGDPLTKQKTQVTYTVRHLSDLGSSTGGPNVSIKAKDKRLGCIPKM